MNPFTPIPSRTVRNWGEQRLITAIRDWLGNVSPPAPFGLGDDCAVLPPTRHPQLLATDPVIYGQHFDDQVPARAVGAKLLKRNLSDIAAMGGRPVAAVISLALAPETSTAWLRGFYCGLADCARTYRVKIVGGDIAQAPVGFFGAFLTLHGEATGRVMLRQGARNGDMIYVTGRLGGSSLGHHYRFAPRLREGLWLSRRPEVRTLMDVSDGLAKDIFSLSTNGLAPALVAASIPIGNAARRLARQSGQHPLDHALTDGEDYELLFTVRARSNANKLERDWRRSFPRVRLTRIGAFVPPELLPPEAIDFTRCKGFEHLR